MATDRVLHGRTRRSTSKRRDLRIEPARLMTTYELRDRLPYFWIVRYRTA